MAISDPNERQSERTTLHKVATLAGVSASTVSLVLAGKADGRRISAATCERVRSAADRLNYAPNLLTRSLRGGRTHILSFYSAFRHRENNDLYMDTLSSAIETAGGKLGYDILVHCNFQRTPREVYQFLNGGLADGLLLFAPLPDDPLLPLLRRSNLPVVLINKSDPLGQYPSVVDDQRSGLSQIADRLISLGHRRIATLEGIGEEDRDAEYRTGLLSSLLAERGVEVQEEWKLRSGGDLQETLGKVCADPQGPTALFCWHDRLAYRVLGACEELGIQVPERLSIVGYDGLHWPSKSRHVAASVEVNLQSLAERAVALLDRCIQGEGTFVGEEVLPVQLIEGTSLGFAPDAIRDTGTVRQ